MVRKLIILSALFSFFFSFSIAALAGQPSYPAKTIRLIVPYTPGSGNDVQTRGITPYVEKQLKVSILIDNRPGADGRIGMTDGWKSPPNGYNLINPGIPTPIIGEKLFPVPYKCRDFTHIFAWSQDNLLLVVNAETWKTPEEFIAAAQAKTLSCGISGTGSSSHVIGFALEDAAKLKPVNWVPFGGGSESVTQLAGKHIDFAITTTSSTLSLVAGGKIRPLLIFSNEKDPMYPNAPIPKDIGLNITAMPIVRGICGPPGLPAQIRDTLEQAFFKAAQDPGFIAYAQKTRLPLEPISGAKFLDFTVGADKEITKWIDKIKSQVK